MRGSARSRPCTHRRSRRASACLLSLPRCRAIPDPEFCLARPGRRAGEEGRAEPAHDPAAGVPQGQERLAVRHHVLLRLRRAAGALCDAWFLSQPSMLVVACNRLLHCCPSWTAASRGEWHLLSIEPFSGRQAPSAEPEGVLTPAESPTWLLATAIARLSLGFRISCRASHRGSSSA